MTYRCLLRVSAICLLTCGIAAAVETEAALESLFRKTSTLEGRPYALARDQFIHRGKAILPLARRFAKSDDWRLWSLAEILRLHIERPGDAALWRFALTHWKVDVREEDGALSARFDAAVTTIARQQGVELPDKPIALPAEIVPIALDVLREHRRFAGQGHTREMGAVGRTLSVLHHFADPRTAEPLLAASGVLYRNESQVIDTLARIGRPALPALHRALQSDDTESTQSRRAMVTARVLAKIGDGESAALLIAAVDRLTWADAVPVYCRAIQELRPEGAEEVLFKQLVDAATGWPGRKIIVNSTSFENYKSIRRSFMALGKPAEAWLARRRRTDPSPVARAIASGGAYHLKNPGATPIHFPSRHGPDDSARVPGPVLLERAAVNPNDITLRALGRLAGDPLAIDLLTRELLTGPRAGLGKPWAVLALAEVAGTQAIDIYRKRFAKHPGCDIAAVLEALVYLNDPAAAPLLDEMLAEGAPLAHPRHLQQAANARLIRDVLRAKDPDPAELLTAGPIALRLAAARAMAARGDIRSVGVLFPAAVAWSADPREAREAKGPYRYSAPAHRTARQAIVRMGEAAIPAIETTAAGSEAPYAGLLARSFLLRIREPGLVRKFEQAGSMRSPGWRNIRGPGVQDFRATGGKVAGLVGAEAVPLLEAAVVWGGDRVSPAVAAFALARLKHDDSIPVILKNCAKFGFARGESLAPAALKDFGERGVAAAGEVPAADPSRAGFRGRVSRHRAATGALTESELEAGVDGVLAGLKLAADGQIEPYRTNIYLRLAGKHSDDRLPGAVIAAVERQGDDIARSALAVLVKSEDPKIVPVCLNHLGASDDALRGLLKIKKASGIRLLLDRLDTSDDINHRVDIVRALAKLRPGQGQHAVPATAGVAEDSLKRNQPAIRGRLIALTNQSPPALRKAAADSLMNYVGGNPGGETVEVLLGWTRDAKETQMHALRYLSRSGDDRVPEAFLDIYRQAPLKSAHLAKLLADMRFEPALADVAGALDHRLAASETKWGVPEVRALADFGSSGRDALCKLTGKHGDLQFLVAAYETLASKGDRRGFEPAARLFEQLAANGMWDARVHSVRGRRRSDAYAYSMSTLANALLSMDPSRGYVAVTRACLSVSDPPARDLLSEALAKAVRDDPKLKKIIVPLPGDPLGQSTGKPAQTTLPLLAACDLWLPTIAKQNSTSFPGDLRDTIIAAGEDSLQIGIELFYGWPEPTAGEIAEALERLASKDETRRRQATALLALRKYPAELLDNGLSQATGEALARGLQVRGWRQRGGGILDANQNLRGQFTRWMLMLWPIDQLRRFTLPRLDRLARIKREAYVWTDKPIYPLLASLRYSKQAEDRQALVEFAAHAEPVPADIARRVIKRGHRGLTLPRVNSRWGPLP